MLANKLKPVLSLIYDEHLSIIPECSGIAEVVLGTPIIKISSSVDLSL